MLRWLRNQLRHWLLLDESERKPETIELWVDGRIRRAAVRGVMGLKLVVSLDGRRLRLVGDNESLIKPVSKKAFWAAWKAYNDQDLIWEDGSRFQPPT